MLLIWINRLNNGGRYLNLRGYVFDFLRSNLDYEKIIIINIIFSGVYLGNDKQKKGVNIVHCVRFPALKSFQGTVKELQSRAKSVFSNRTDESSAVQYFQVCIFVTVVIALHSCLYQ